MEDTKNQENTDKGLEKIRKQKINERLEKLEKQNQKVKKQNQELKKEVEQLKAQSNTPTKARPSKKRISRREFLKKAGLGTVGLAALGLSPASALNLRSDSLSFEDGSDTEYLNIDTSSNEIKIDNGDLIVSEGLRLPQEGPGNDPSDGDNRFWVDEDDERLKVNIGGTVYTSEIRRAIPDTQLTQQADHIWFMDEGSGDTISDSEGNADGSRSGADWVTGLGGVGDSYLDFTNSDDIVVTDFIFDSDTTEFTVAIWGKPNSWGETYAFHQDVTDGFVFWGGGSREEAQVTIDGDNPGFDEGDGYGTTGEWALLAIRFDSNASPKAEMRIYEAGKEGTQFSDTWDPSDPEFPQNEGREFSFGNNDDLNRQWDGALDFAVASKSDAGADAIDDHFEKTREYYE